MSQQTARQASEDHMSKMLQEGFLNEKCAYNKFSTFLDFKDDHVFTGFRRKLENFAEQHGFQWTEMDEEEDRKRHVCSESFLAQFGEHYWGKEPGNREKYLTSSDDPEENCSWPKDKEPITHAVATLLWKISRGKGKGKRDSVSQTTPAPAMRVVQYSQTQQPTQPPKAAKPAQIPQPSQNIQSPQYDEHVKRAVSAEPVTPNRIKKDVSATPNMPRKFPQQMPESTKQTHRKPSAGPSTFREPVQTSTKLMKKPIKICFPENPGAHDQRTYFLVREEENPMKARSIAWQMFKTSSEMIDRMVSDLATDEDPSERQLWTEINIARYAYAEVCLTWSQDLKFVIRRDNDSDLQELVRHVACAWYADGQGKISTAEFRIEVMLKT